MVGNLFDFLFGPLRDRFYASFFRRRDKQREVACAALERIRKERPNFEHIVARRSYKNAAHKEAVTEASFNLLDESMGRLQKVRKFRRQASAVLNHARHKDAQAVLNVINRLEPRLDRFCSG